MALSAGEMQEKFDAAIEAAKDKDYIIRSYADPTVLAPSPEIETVVLESIINLLSPGDRHRCKGRRHIKNFVDVLTEWEVSSGCSLDQLGEIWRHGPSSSASERLPFGIRPKRPLGDRDVMQLLISQGNNGKHTVLKVFHLHEPISQKEALDIASGKVAFVPFRQNTFGARKAFQFLLQQTVGWRMLFADVCARRDEHGEAARASKKQDWNPSKAEIAEGIAYIKENAPASGSLEQVEWMLINVKASDSVIRGWPLGYVQKCCDIKAKTKGGAEVEQNFPLTIFDLKPVFIREVLPQALHISSVRAAHLCVRVLMRNVMFLVVYKAHMMFFSRCDYTPICVQHKHTHTHAFTV